MPTDQIVILGAGPGGCAAALKLHQLGLRCTLIDKASFPRDKVCGDAVSGKALTILRRIDPGIERRLLAQRHQYMLIWGIRFVAPNGITTDVPFRKGYDPGSDPVQGLVSRRMDFDNFLVEEVQRCEGVDLQQATQIRRIERVDNGFLLVSDNGQRWQTPLLIVANGAQSAFARQHAGLKKDPAHFAGAVRAYFEGVEGLHPDGFIELHFLKEITPGYFWIFPLPDGSANVGLGMRSDYIARHRINLRKTLLRLIESHPALEARFRKASMQGEVKGFPLPLGSKLQSLSGDHYMLVGDAGHLIDPLSGEGIGNAIYSGFMAAEQALHCLETGNFGRSFLKAYDARVERVLGAEMKLSYQLQRFMSRVWLVNLTARLVAARPDLIYTISDMYADLALRKQVFNPLFWIKKVFFKGKS